MPVSAMIHIPKAQGVLDEGGCVLDPGARADWDKYSDRCFSQLEWWAVAAKSHRADVDPFADSPALRSYPAQRNSPSIEAK